jgi:hypothetical protein
MSRTKASVRAAIVAGGRAAVADMDPGTTLVRGFTPLQLSMTAANATTGVWTLALSAAAVPTGYVGLHKAAAATTSVVHFNVPRGPKSGRIGKIEVFYQVTTAALTSAPTAVLNKHTIPGGTGTGLAALAAVTQTLTFAGIDAVGTAAGAAAAGAHIAVVTITTPATLADYEALALTLTMNEAATSVLDITGMAVTWTAPAL